jgi:ring-1,2-phenylacetyl-CoA epoxidase subunit PaaC
LILGYRHNEWWGRGPDAEQSLAFVNIALDEVNHALLWYTLLTDLLGENPETHSNRLIYRRYMTDFRCAQLVELPNGSWAFSLLRQYLFDAAEKVWLDHLCLSRYRPLATTALTIYAEEIYHFSYISACMRRLALTDEHCVPEMQMALDQLWRYARQLFTALPGSAPLVDMRYIPDRGTLQGEWTGVVEPLLVEIGLRLPEHGDDALFTREQHTPFLEELLRSRPAAKQRRAW